MHGSTTPSVAEPTDVASQRRESRTLVAAMLAILLAVTGFQWWQLEASTAKVREETLAQARLRASEVAGAASEVIAILFRSVDIASRELVDAYLTTRGPAFEARVRQTIDRLPHNAVLQVAVIGADGYLVYSNLGMSERPFLGDREHFKVHLEEGADRFFISRPVLGRVSKQWSIQFSRPIRRQGQLAGVMVMSISPAYLHEAMVRLTLESGDSLAVLRGSGEVLARNRDQEAVLGKIKDAQAPYLQPASAASGSFIGRADTDGIERIYHWRQLDQYPIRVVLGLSSASALRPLDRLVSEARKGAILSAALLWSAVGAVALLIRLMGRHRLEREALEFVAMHDSLTGLHSRHALMEHLDHAIENAAARGTRLGVLYLDLDGFKPVNDQYGHGIGDEVLQAVAGRLKGCARKGDFPARIGGDEFVVVIDPLPHDGVLEGLHTRVAAALAAPLRVGDAQIQIGASLGLACYPEDGANADALLSAADRRMYEDKRSTYAERSGGLA